MKNAMLSLVLFVGAMGFDQSALAGAPSKLVEISSFDLIIPTGLDSTSDSYITETGWLNGCSTWDHATVTNAGGNVIEIASYAMVRSGNCPMIMAPYHKKVDLGQLNSGVYQIRLMNSDGTYFQDDLTIN